MLGIGMNVDRRTHENDDAISILLPAVDQVIVFFL
jgi:hypothetical protein